MARTTTNKTTISEDTIEETVSNKKLDMDEKIVLRSIANWTVGFNKIESMGEVNINAHGTTRIPRAEVISQYENGNKLIVGSGNGKHATIYIDDKPTRDYLEYQGELINKKLITQIFDIEGLNDFREKINDTVKTRAEKLLLISLIRECKFNDFNKIRECEIICGKNV